MKLGISQKIILLFIFLVIILTAGIGTYFVRRERTMLLSEFDERARMLLSSAVTNSEYPLLVGDVETIDKIGKGILKQRDVVFYEIIDKEGKSVLQEGTQKERGVRKYSSPILTERQTGTEELLLGSKAKVSEEIGKVSLTLSIDSLMEKINEVRKAIGLLVILGIVLASLFINLLVRFVLGRPINRLMKGIEVISGGDLSYKVPLKTRDEIGMLATSFNRMTEELQKTTVSRDELVKEATEREKAEKELKEAYDKLKQVNLELMQERSAIMNMLKDLEEANKDLKRTQAQLIQTAKMASIGQLAAGLAHEINNPLTGVLNNVQLIKMEMESKTEALSPAELKEVLDVIEESALRCKKITQSLLDFSHASKAAIQPILVNEIVEKVINLISYELRLQNIIIQTGFSGQLPLIQGNPQLLQQVFMNLIANSQWAIKKKSGTEGGTITIKTEYDSPKDRVNIYLSDAGIGMSSETVNRLFEPFFTTKEIGEGTGLGLSVLYGIIQGHKGTIEVESEIGKGTTFKISLPAFHQKETV